MLFFHEALGSIEGNPVLEFSAAIVYFAEFHSFIFHRSLDAQDRTKVTRACQMP